MTGNALKDAILQEAVTGRLVKSKERLVKSEERLAKSGEGQSAEGKPVAAPSPQPCPPALPPSSLRFLPSAKPVKQSSKGQDKGEPFAIPKGWKWVRLGEVCEDMETIKPTKDFIYIDIDAIDNRKNAIRNAKHITLGEQSSRATRKVKEGDVLFSKVRPYLRNIAYVTAEYADAIASSGFYVVRPSKVFDSKYLFYLMLSNYVVNSVNTHMRGYNSPSVTDDVIFNLPLPLPPLDEQKRIVQKVEELLPLAEEYGKCERELRELDANIARRARQAVLQEAVTGRLAKSEERLVKSKEGQSAEGKIVAAPSPQPCPPALPPSSLRFLPSKPVKQSSKGQDGGEPFVIPKGWKWVRLGEVCECVTKGTTPTGCAYTESGIGFLRAENVAGYEVIDKTNLKYVDDATNKGQLSRSILMANDILITIAGTLGRTALVRKNDLPLNVNQAVAIVRGLHNNVDVHYLIVIINSPTIQKLLTAQKKVTAIPNLTLEIIRNLPLPLPPLDEQKRIVQKVEELLPLCSKLGEGVV